MDRIAEFLKSQGFVVLDGGLATELENRGASLDDPLWSAKILLSDPEKIAGVHQTYFEAGADVATTASYQATFPGLAAAGLGYERAKEVMLRSVTLAVDARDRFWSDEGNRRDRLRPLVAASIGPYGAFLHDGSEYRGDYELGRPALEDFHRERLLLLATSGADLLAIESIPSLVEAQALVNLLADVPHTSAWLSFTCKDESHISDGTKFADAVQLASASPSVVAVGLNCTAPHLVDKLLKRARAVTNKPLVVYPNSGEVYDVSSRTWHSHGETCFIENSALKWFALGARLLGGCCRTTPETIRKIRASLTASPLGDSGNKSPSDRSPSPSPA